ncbi:MAG: mechanosensitive ion channel domain-containing protein [Burkholderiales bacterium]
MTEIEALARQALQPGVLIGIAVLLGCVAIAYLVSHLAGRQSPKDSVWFGRAVFDGLMFPLLALALAWGADQAIEGEQASRVLQLGVPIFMSLAVIRLLARVFARVFPASGAARAAERVFSWLAWIGAVLWIVGVLPTVLAEMERVHLMFGATRISLLGVVQGALLAGLVLVLALWLSAALEKHVLNRAMHDLSLRRIASNATRAVLLVVAALVALSAVGIDLTALSVLGGAIGVGLGFGLQKLAANYISGFVILFERSLRIGDMVSIEGCEGTVMDIRTRYTLIRALNGRESIVPNEKLITERIENLSLADPMVLLSTSVGVGYDSDAELVQKILVDSALKVERVLLEPAPGARLANFGADGLEFTLLFWIKDPQNGQLNVRSEVNLQILTALRAANVEIPFPQRVVHVQTAAQAPASLATSALGAVAHGRQRAEDDA